MKNLLFLLAFVFSFNTYAQVETKEFQDGYLRGYKKAYLKKNRVDFNGTLNFKDVYSWIEINSFLHGNSYNKKMKQKNYERGYYSGYYKVCGCFCDLSYGLGVRRDLRAYEKINKNISKYRKKISNLKDKFAKTKQNNLLLEIDENQETIRLIMASCNEFL